MGKVYNFRRDEGKTWSWMYDGVAYKTDKNGEGIWELKHDGTYSQQVTDDGETVICPHLAWNQIVGTCDFWLRDMSPSGARRKTNKFFDRYF